MARPKKQEVDYFPHYCDHGKVLFILENHFKNDGYAVFYKIEELLAKTEGHCYDCSKLENWEYLLSKMLVTEDIVINIMEKLSSMGVIDKELWQQKKIWMQSFIDSIADAYARRKVQLPTRPVLINTKTQLNGINDDINSQEASFNQNDDNHNPQRKEKKRKENIILGVYSNAFQAFWSEYPKSIKKKAAFKEWEKCPNKPSIEEILVALRAQKRNKAELSSKGLFCPEWPDPERWIKNERWNDELIPVPKNGNGIGDKQQESAYELCPSCGAELRKGYEYVIIGGKQCCEKCPQAKEKAKEDFKKLSGFMGGIKSMPATA